jgi:hypothetical protein
VSQIAKKGAAASSSRCIRPHIDMNGRYPKPNAGLIRLSLE